MVRTIKGKLVVIGVIVALLVIVAVFFCQRKEARPVDNDIPAATSVKTVAEDGSMGQEGSQDASGSYTAQLTAYVEQELIGTWKGTLDEYPGADSVYSSYTFQEDGKYTYSDGVATESGTYTVLCDAADVDYNGALTLTSGSGSRTVKFYFTATTPAQMVTDQADPTFVKQ